MYFAKLLCNRPIIQKQLKTHFLDKVKDIDFSAFQKGIYNNMTLYTILFILMTYFWYVYVASVPFTNGVLVLNNIIESVRYSYGTTADLEPYTILTYQTQYIFHMVKKYLHLFSQFCIFVGTISIPYIWRKYNLKIEYVALVLANFVILILALVVPHVAGVLNTERTYHIALIYLAPMSVLGFYVGVNFLNRSVLPTYTKNLKKNATPILSLCLISLFLLNSGFVYELSNEPSSSYSLSKFKAMNYAVYSEEELKTIYWLNRHETTSLFYSDSMITESASRLEQKINGVSFSRLQGGINEDYGVFLRQYNTISGEIRTGYGETYIMSVKNLVNKKCEVYSSDTTKVYM
jgi:uncharacterized membrane protein